MQAALNKSETKLTPAGLHWEVYQNYKQYMFACTKYFQVSQNVSCYEH